MASSRSHAYGVPARAATSAKFPPTSRPRALPPCSGVASGEVAVALEHVIADDGLPAERLRVLDRPVEIGGAAQRTSGRNKRDACASAQWRWKSHAKSHART